LHIPGEDKKVCENIYRLDEGTIAHEIGGCLMAIFLVGHTNREQGYEAILKQSKSNTCVMRSLMCQPCLGGEGGWEKIKAEYPEPYFELNGQQYVNIVRLSWCVLKKKDKPVRKAILNKMSTSKPFFMADCFPDNRLPAAYVFHFGKDKLPQTNPYDTVNERGESWKTTTKTLLIGNPLVSLIPSDAISNLTMELGQDLGTQLVGEHDRPAPPKAKPAPPKAKPAPPKAKPAPPKAKPAPPKAKPAQPKAKPVPPEQSEPSHGQMTKEMQAGLDYTSSKGIDVVDLTKIVNGVIAQAIQGEREKHKRQIEEYKNQLAESERRRKACEEKLNQQNTIFDRIMSTVTQCQNEEGDTNDTNTMVPQDIVSTTPCVKSKKNLKETPQGSPAKKRKKVRETPQRSDNSNKK
jgi:hypothetical protein